MVKLTIICVQPTNGKWAKLADLAMNILLVKLTIAGTDLLKERLNGGDNYVQTDDAGMLRLIRGITRTNEIFVTSVKEVVINQIDQMAVKYDGRYLQEGESIHVIELESKMAVIANPTRSAIIDDYMVDADAVKEKLEKMGYKSSLLVKRNERSNSNRLSKKARFKPRKNMGHTTKNRYKKEKAWVPDVIRRSQEGKRELPAVIIR